MVSHAALGSSWEFLGVCYGTMLFLSDLTPTIGLFQSVFVALFDRYRYLFLILLHGHYVGYLIPLGLRFRKQPLFMAAMLLLLTAVLKSYPCTADIGVGLSLLSVHDKVVAGELPIRLAARGFPYCRCRMLRISLPDDRVPPPDVLMAGLGTARRDPAQVADRAALQLVSRPDGVCAGRLAGAGRRGLELLLLLDAARHVRADRHNHDGVRRSSVARGASGGARGRQEGEAGIGLTS